MPQKTMVRKQSSPGDYLVIHPNQPPDTVAEPEKTKVKKILDDAEKDLKDVFDNSGHPSLASGVKLGLIEL
jgi:hypothetical protein